MKVIICPVCRITPELSAAKAKCPKCGRMATGESLTETLTRWNNGETTVAPKVTVEEIEKSFVKDAAPEEPFMNEPVEDVKEEKPKKAPVKRRKRSE